MSKLFHPQIKMATVLQQNHLLLPVVNRFGMRPGFGDKTIAEICTLQQVDPNFFTDILNTYAFPDYFPEQRLLGYDLQWLIAYLHNTHEYYLNVSVVQIEQLFDRLMRSCASSDQSINLVQQFFVEYKRDLSEHLQHEEQVTFPYMSAIYNCYQAMQQGQTPPVLQWDYSMQEFEKEHSNIDEKIFDLRTILLKYISGCFDLTVYNQLIVELHRLENDIRDHTRIEERIVRPLVSELERQLKLPRQ